MWALPSLSVLAFLLYIAAVVALHITGRSVVDWVAIAEADLRG